MTGAKGCWRRCSAPSTMSSSSPTRRSLQWRQLQAHRMIDCIHVMLEIWLQIVTSQLRRMKPARVMCGPQLLLMDQSSLWSSSRMMPMWTRKFTSKCWQKKCCLGSLKVFINYYIFAQEGASSHTPNLTQQWCKDNFQRVLGQKNVSSLMSKHHLNRLCYLVHLREWCLGKILLKCGCTEKFPSWMKK